MRLSLHLAARFLCFVSSFAVIACDDGPAGEVLSSLPPAEISAETPPSGFSAPLVFFASMSPLTYITDPSCPTQTEEGDVVVLQGGCTDLQGLEWFGRATIPVGMMPSDVTEVNGVVMYEDFGNTAPSPCPTATTTVRQRSNGTFSLSSNEEVASFDANLVVTTTGVLDDCEEGERRTAIDYSGTVKVEGNGAQTWSGSGSVGSDAVGRYDVRTDAEVINEEICPTEAVSGTTTVTAGEHVAVFTYDGATDCNPESTVTWTLDGVPQGELMYVRCSATPGHADTPVALVVALGVVLARGARRLKRRA